MIRTFIALTILAVALAFKPAPASACISCSYKPQVITTPVPGAKAKPRKQQRAHRKAPAVKKKTAKRHTPAPKQEATVKATPAPEPVEQTKSKSTESVSTAKLENNVDENASSSDTTAALDCMKFSPTAGTTVPVPCE